MAEWPNLKIVGRKWPNFRILTFLGRKWPNLRFSKILAKIFDFLKLAELAEIGTFIYCGRNWPNLKVLLAESEKIHLATLASELLKHCAYCFEALAHGAQL